MPKSPKKVSHTYFNPVTVRRPRNERAWLAPGSLLALIFVFAGLVKVGLPWITGGPGFSTYLEILGVPLAPLVSALVVGLELGGGVLLFFPRWAALAACFLSVHLSVAICLVGIPGLFQEPVQLGNFQVGGEWWRLPLEAGLVLALVLLAFKGPYTPGGRLRS